MCMGGTVMPARRRLDRVLPKWPQTRLTATAGITQGRLCLDAAALATVTAGGEPAILVQHDLATADISAIAAATGILTCVGARTVHAAVVARQMGKVCLVGCRSLVLLAECRACRIGEQELGEGELPDSRW